MGRTQRFGKGRFSSVDGVGAQGTGFAAAGLVLALAAQADAQTELVPTVSNAGVTAAKLAADGTLELTLANGENLVLAAEQFTIAADGSVVLTDAVVQQIATLLGIEATGLGVTLVPLAGAGGLGLALAGGGEDTTPPDPSTAAVVGGTSTGSVTEDSDALLTVSGKLTVTDPDPGQASFVPFVSRGQSAIPIVSIRDFDGSLGTFSIAADGTWNYSVPNAAVQNLGLGQTKVETFEVSTVDGTKQTVSVTITGTNDAAVISGQSSAVLTEDSSPLSVSGKLTVTDVDSGEASFIPGMSMGHSAGYLGTFNIKADGTWTYEVPNALVQYLGAGATRSERFEVSTVDGTKHTLSVTIIGTNDRAIVTGQDSGGLSEQSEVRSVSGKLTVSDPDANQSIFQAQSSLSGTYGTASIDRDGNWTYTLNSSETGIPGLRPGDTVEDRITVTTLDGTTHEVVITITGTAAFNEVNLADATPDSGVGFVINGLSENTESGFIVTNVGDVNGDGLDDVLVAQRYAEETGARSEDSYVVFGKPDGKPVELSDIQNGIGGFVIQGQEPDDGPDPDAAKLDSAEPTTSLGMTISKLGDVNGDGLADLLVTTVQSGGLTAGTGTAYVVFGKAGTDAVNLADVAAGKGGFAITNIPVSELGIRIAGGGDINGDGIADFVLGLPESSEPYSPPGATPGASGVPVMIGVPGKVYAIFGGIENGVRNLSDIDAGKGGGFKITNGAVGDNFGMSVAIVGDVNGDGFDDIAIGAPKASNGLGEAGSVTVVYGKADTDAVTAKSLEKDDAGFVISGAASDSRFGSMVAAAGDVNGDGLADIFIGSNPAGGAEPLDVVPLDSGDPGPSAPKDVTMAHVVLGQSVTQNVDLKETNHDRVLQLAAPDSNQIWAISGAGDVDGDGMDDLIVGVYTVDGPVPAAVPGGSADSGLVKDTTYVISGATLTNQKTIVLDDGLVGTPGTRLIYQAEWSDGQGRSVSGGGDVNGDGFDDLIISAQNASPNGDYSGQTHVVFGGILAKNNDGVQIGGAGNDTVTGSQPEDRLIGGAGDDLLDASKGGTVLIGGAGDDELVIGLGTSRADGGTGRDTLTLSARGDGVLDLTAIPDMRLQSIEVINLGGQKNTLRIDESEVLRLSESTNTLRVIGGSGDQVQLVGMEWQRVKSLVEDGIEYNVFVSGNARVEIAETVHHLGGPLPAVTFSDGVSGYGGLVINGPINFSQAGYSVKIVGDVNNDGLADILVGAPDGVGRLTSGAAYVVFGKESGGTYELLDAINGKGGFLILGEYDSDGAGWSVSGLGDINGDGFDDLVVSAPGYDIDDDGEIIEDVGAVYIVYGKADGGAVDLTNVGKGIGGSVIDGIFEDRFTGLSVDGAGDVNGDGIGDLVIGVQYSTAHGKNAGAAYIVFGNPDDDGFVSLSELEADKPVGGFAIHGVTPGELAGATVRAAGDVNGDGLDDVIIGACGALTLDHGAAYVVFGKASTDMVHLDEVARGIGGFMIKGAVGVEDVSVGGKTDWLGWSVSGIGDVDGDGLDDVLVGAPFASDDHKESGLSFIVFGKADGGMIDLASDSSAGAAIAIIGDEADARTGFTVSGAGDVNGDGMLDLIIGAPTSTGSEPVAGAAYVVFGREEWDVIRLSDVRAGIGGFVVLGEATTDKAGFSVHGGGDVNGDGFDDIVVGVPQNDPNGLDSGAAVVVFGGNFTGAVNKLGDAGANIILGTAGNEIIFGAQGDDTIFGGGGIDRLSGGAGADQFVIIDAPAVTTIVDFDGEAGDQLILSSFNLTTFADVQSRLSQQGNDLRLALDDNTTVILSGLEPDVLTASHVIL